MQKTGLLLGLLCFFYFASAQESSRITVHDPVLIKQDSTYYIFCTGMGITTWASHDLKTWTKMRPVFATAPEWAVQAVPGFKGHIWAPDISYYKGQYYLYYSVSAFGKNTSCIGLAINKTLDTTSPDYKWVDYGKVIQSYPGKTNWNAIDPNAVVDENGNSYLVFGSFWDGIKLVRLQKDRLHLAQDSTAISTIASRKKPPTDSGDNAIEAPFIFKKGNYYYLFASIDYCCRGVNSTYKMIVGRSKKLQGPYVDAAGVEMRSGGGTILLQGNKDWYGLGHNAVYNTDGKDYILFHGYDATDNGRPKLILKELGWTKKDWPFVITE